MANHGAAAKRAEKYGQVQGGFTREMRKMLGAASVQIGRDRTMELCEQAIDESEGTFTSWVAQFNRLLADENAA